MNIKNSFNFIIIGYNSELYKTSYADILDFQHVKYVPNTISSERSALCLMPKSNPIIHQLHRIHHAKIINNIINLPFKNIWFKHYYKSNFNNEKPLCFIFFGRNAFLANHGLIDYLKKKHIGAKFICYFQDLVINHNDVDIQDLKKIFDLLITFDYQDAKNNNIDYFPLVNSKYKFKLDESIKKSDIYFLGAAKNRLSDIITAYEKLKDKNLICDFYITGVKREEQVYQDEIKYIDSMSYLENLYRINRTKCMLELMQKNGHGYTQRMMEAIIYDKKIITNNPTVKNAPFYNPTNILHIENVSSITDDSEFYKNFSRNANHEYKDNISPNKLLEFIENKLKHHLK